MRERKRERERVRERDRARERERNRELERMGLDPPRAIIYVYLLVDE